MNAALPKKPLAKFGFTLIELLVSLAVLAILSTILIYATDQVSRVVRQNNERADAFQSARGAFDVITRNLSQATLNTYWALDDEVNPTRYLRASDLHFLVEDIDPDSDRGRGVYFQAPLGLAGVPSNETESLLNACGYHVEFGDGREYLPPHVSGRNRFRLMQSLQRTEDFSVFTDTGAGWVPGLRDTSSPLAENIVLLLAWPRYPLAESSAATPRFAYDSRLGLLAESAQLPPVVDLTMVAVDENSAARLSDELQILINQASEGRFRDPLKLQEDLDDLENELQQRGINYRVFSTSVPLRESKWSNDQ